MRGLGFEATAKSTYPFVGVRCEHIVLGVFARLAELSADHSRVRSRFLTPNNPSPLKNIGSAARGGLALYLAGVNDENQETA